MKRLTIVFWTLIWVQPVFSQVTISPGADSKPFISSGGKNVWPPQGPGCQDLVRCCDSASKLESSVNLMCQLSVSAQSVDCPNSLKTVKQYLSERNLKAPPECGN